MRGSSGFKIAPKGHKCIRRDSSKMESDVQISKHCRVEFGRRLNGFQSSIHIHYRRLSICELLVSSFYFRITISCQMFDIEWGRNSSYRASAQVDGVPIPQS